MSIFGVERCTVCVDGQTDGEAMDGALRVGVRMEWTCLT